MNNIMLDLETMGNGPTAAITAIGAVRFDLNGLSDRFYALVSLQSCQELGLTLDAGTVLWWLKQSDAARAEFDRPCRGIRSALLDFSSWVGNEPRVWGNGASFDNVILGNAYRAAGQRQPWAFWHDRCYRTIKSLHPDIRMERSGTHHNAVDDAESQAEHLIRILTTTGEALR